MFWSSLDPRSKEFVQTETICELTSSQYNTLDPRLDEATLATKTTLPFWHEVEVTGDTALVKCHGRVVTDTVGNFRQVIQAMIPEYGRMVIDLSDVAFVDSRGLDTMVAVERPRRPVAVWSS